MKKEKTDEIEEEPSRVMGDIDNLSLGEKPKPIQPKTITILDFKVVPVEKDGKSIGNKLVLTCNHPDIGDIEISKARYEKNGRLMEAGLWIKEGEIPYTSAIGSMLRYKGLKMIKDLRNVTIGTVLDDNGYLVIKAY